MTLTIHSALGTNNFNNLCMDGVTITHSDAINTSKAVDGTIPGDCDDDKCLEISASGWVTLDLGSSRDISTIVFLADSPDGSSGGGVRTYGTSSDPEDTCTNSVIAQDEGTNYAGMIADLNNGV